MPYTKPDASGAKESYKIVRLHLDLAEAMIQINLRYVSYDTAGLPTVADVVLYIDNRQIDSENKGDIILSFDAVAASITSGNSLYSEIKSAVYKQLVAQGDLPDTGWTIE